MRVRNITTCALGLAAALSVVASPLAAQTQDTTKLRRPSEQRIGISKGEVVSTPRVDTVYVTRYDTVRVDNTIVRVDTVTVATPAPIIPAKIKGPMFWGVYAGPTEPWGNIDRLYTNGFHGGGVLGWESQHSMFGVRLNGDMSQINREQARNTAVVGTGTPLMLTLGADAKVKPLNFGGWALYALGGVNYNRYKRIATAAAVGTSGAACGQAIDGKPGSNQCYTPASDTRWSDKFGFNFGAGTDFHIGSQDMFFEARYVAVPADGARTWFLPISLGVRYF
jgi:hypothetical protein